MADGGGDYFSIDAVLAEETAIPCAFQCGAQGIGRALDASSGETTVGVKHNSHVLCPMLALSVRHMWLEHACLGLR